LGQGINTLVMPGLAPGIHDISVFGPLQNVDGRA
jgi:hypothetical protein